MNTSSRGISDFDFADLDESLSSTLLRPVETLNLTTRARNTLDRMDVTTIGELMQLNESQLLRWPNVGRSTIQNIEDVLAQFGFSLGTSIKNWPTKDEISRLTMSKRHFRWRHFPAISMTEIPSGTTNDAGIRRVQLKFERDRIQFEPIRRSRSGKSAQFPP